MTATYDPALPTDKDWIRFLIGDSKVTANTSTVTNPSIQDEEINALSVEERNKYLAAARAGEVIIAKGRGAVQKTVSNLSIAYGDSPESAYRSHLQGLREKGAEILLPNKRVFRVV